MFAVFIWLTRRRQDHVLFISKWMNCRWFYLPSFQLIAPSNIWTLKLICPKLNSKLIHLIHWNFSQFHWRLIDHVTCSPSPLTNFWGKNEWNYPFNRDCRTRSVNVDPVWFVGANCFVKLPEMCCTPWMLIHLGHLIWKFHPSLCNMKTLSHWIWWVKSFIFNIRPLGVKAIRVTQMRKVLWPHSATGSSSDDGL